MSTTLTAANRLRREVLSMSGVVLIEGDGLPDKVIRILPTPDNLNQFKKKNHELNIEYISINPGVGPQREAWREVERMVYLMSPRTKPIPQPLFVAPNSRSEWSIPPEDVPLVLLQQEDVRETLLKQENKLITTSTNVQVDNFVGVVPEKVEKESVKIEFKCPKCGKTLKNDHAVRIHLGRFHK